MPCGQWAERQERTSPREPSIYTVGWVTSFCPPKIAQDSRHGLYPPSSSVYGILQARILEWVAMPFSIKVTYHLLIQKNTGIYPP